MNLTTLSASLSNFSSSTACEAPWSFPRSLQSDMPARFIKLAASVMCLRPRAYTDNMLAKPVPLPPSARHNTRMELSRPFVRLPLSFDATRLADEVGRMPATAWMPHPSGLAGNSAVALISRDGGENDEFNGAMATTAHLAQAPYHQQVLASFDEVLARSRLMKLAAGCEVSSHVDFNYHWYSRVRIHIPVITNPDVTFYCGDEQIHMRAGECWIFDSWRRHNVINRSGEDRVHLVIDTSGSSRFWRMVHAAEQQIPEGLQEIAHLAFIPDQKVALRTERYNVAPVMSPGELDALVRDLIQDFENCPSNAPDLVITYKALLLDFSRDWRELWYEYGYQKAGWPRYRALIERVQESLHPERRALVTASNDVGVNPIIVQRILASALAADQHAAFVDQGN